MLHIFRLATIRTLVGGQTAGIGKAVILVSKILFADTENREPSHLKGRWIDA
jgi:hypothetical protein